MQIIRVIILMICIGSISWGAKLIYSSFLLEKELMYIVKYSEEVVPKEAEERHAEQSFYQLIVQLGLVISGTAGATWLVLSLFKSHNHRVHLTTHSPRAPAHSE